MRATPPDGMDGSWTKGRHNNIALKRCTADAKKKTAPRSAVPRRENATLCWAIVRDLETRWGLGRVTTAGSTWGALAFAPTAPPCARKLRVSTLVSQLPSALCTACNLKFFNVNHAGARNNNCRSVATRYTAIASPWFDPRLAFASTS